MFLCEHLWDPPGATFAVFQCCHHCFHCIEAYIQLRTQYPSHNLPICMDELVESLFILWCNSCSWPSGMWLVCHVAVASAETCHPPPHSANVHCLVSINVQQALMNVMGCNFFHVEEFNYTPLLHTHFSCRRHFVRLPLCCHLSHGNKI